MFTKLIETFRPLTQAIADLWHVNPFMGGVFVIILLFVGGGILGIFGFLISAAVTDIVRNFSPLSDKKLRSINAKQTKKERKGSARTGMLLRRAETSESLECPEPSDLAVPLTGYKNNNYVRSWHLLAKFLWLLIGGAMLFMTYDAVKSCNWPKTEGVIIDSSLKAIRAATGRFHSTEIYLAQASYVYAVNGVKYRGDTGDHINGENISWLGGRGRLPNSKSKVAVYYNPAHPERSVLNPGKVANWGWLMVPLFLYLSFAAPWWLPFRNRLYHLLHR
jgi:hypothetical protein